MRYDITGYIDKADEIYIAGMRDYKALVLKELQKDFSSEKDLAVIEDDLGDAEREFLDFTSTYKWEEVPLKKYPEEHVYKCPCCKGIFLSDTNYCPECGSKNN